MLSRYVGRFMFFPGINVSFAFVGPCRNGYNRGQGRRILAAASQDKNWLECKASRDMKLHPYLGLDLR